MFLFPKRGCRAFVLPLPGGLLSVGHSVGVLLGLSNLVLQLILSPKPACRPFKCLWAVDPERHFPD